MGFFLVCCLKTRNKAAKSKHFTVASSGCSSKGEDPLWSKKAAWKAQWAGGDGTTHPLFLLSYSQNEGRKEVTLSWASLAWKDMLHQNTQQRDNPCCFLLLYYTFPSYFIIHHITGCFLHGRLENIVLSFSFYWQFYPSGTKDEFNFPVNRHIFTVLAQLRGKWAPQHYSFCLLIQLLPYKISYFRNVFQSKSGQNNVSLRVPFQK